jgi:NAD(P)-dependent dehydrogenase (short-subunit alcohol dehydrogenase family)
MEYKSALITGTHSGLGEALSHNLLERGARVYGISRKESELLADHPDWKFQATDLQQFDRIGEAVKRLLNGVEKLDVVILNAGVLGEIKALEDWSLDDVRWVMDINVWANKVLIDVLFDLKIEIGQLVGISSGAAFNGSGGWGPYSISKSALNLLLRTYSDEHPETHFISLAPGLVRTRMTTYVHEQPENERFPALNRVKAAYGSDKMVEPEEGARRLIDALPALRERQSGAFVDIRDLVE